MESGFLNYSREEIELSIPKRFERVVRSLPQQEAIRTSNASCSYRELNEYANQLANALLHVSKNKLVSVGIIFQNDIHVIAAMLGVLKAGCRYVILETTFPIERLQTIYQDADISFVLADHETISVAQKLVSDSNNIINLDMIKDHASKQNPDIQISASCLSAIYYTSGSTGKPKKIVRNHRDLLYRGWIYRDHYKIRKTDRVSQLFSFGFAASISDTFGAILNGATLCVLDLKNSTFQQVTDWLHRQKITIFHPPVAFYRQWIEDLGSAVQFPFLRMIQLGGSALYKKDVDKARLIIPETCILNNRYASTEAGLVASFMIAHDTILTEDIVPIGYPVEGMELKILNEKGFEAEPNAVGEIAIKSRYLPENYRTETGTIIQDESESDAKKESNYFLTGDLGRKDENGCYVHLGRKDSIVKVRGYRVDTNEIASVLNNLPEVKDSFITTSKVPHAPDENQLIAYVVAADGIAISSHGIRDALAYHLPAYMLPSRFIFMEKLPLNSSGKVNSQALPSPLQSRTEPYIPAKNALEKRLTRIWEDEFRIEEISTRDNFFEIGGDSLLAARLHTQIEQQFTRNLPLTFIIENPTIERMAVYLSAGQKNRKFKSLVPIQEGGTKPALYIFPGNAGRILYYFHQLADLLGKDQPVYGLELVQTDPQTKPTTWLKATATTYLREITKFQPHGPYFLAGYSFGGLLAFETAIQLTEAGEQVSFVCLIDSHLTEESPVPEKMKITKRLIKHLRYVKSLPNLERIKYYKSRIRTVMDGLEKYRVIRVIFRMLGYDPRDISPINKIASRTYRPRFYPGKIIYFKALDDTGQKYEQRIEAWKKVASGVEIHTIPGKHGTIFDETHLKILAQKMKQSLNMAQETPIHSDDES